MATTENGLPRRSEVDERYQWDLTHIFATDEEWEKELQAVQALLPQAKAFEGKLTESANTLLQGLKLRDQIYEKMGKVFVYAHLKKDEDSTNSKYVAYENRASSLSVQVNSAFSFMVPEILSMDKTTVDAYIQEKKELSLYRHALDAILRQKEHTLTAEEEAILAQAGELARAPQNIFSMLNDADMTFPTIKDENGEEKQLTHGRYVQFLESRDRRVRRDAFEAMYATFGKQKNTFAATLNASVKKDVFYARVRKYPSSLEAALDPDHVPVEVYENLISTVREHLPLFHRYMHLRKRVLGVEDLHLYDVYVPLVNEKDMRYPYEQAQELVRQSLQPLGESYLAVVDQGFREKWIDVYENEGKRSGAYSSGTYGTPPYILLNYQDTLDHVFTLAHEMGHSVHSYFSREAQPFVYSNYTIFVAEVASTLNEALLTHYMLEHMRDPHQKMVILNHYLDGFRGTVFRQTMFAEFEKLIHEQVEKGGALTPDVLNDLYYDLNLAYFGEEMVVDREISLEWARIPHFYMTFYVYKYATGFAAATALSQQILKEGKTAVERYLRFLKSGGSDYPLELLKKAGVDMSSAQPIRDALQVFESTLDDLESLLGYKKE